MKRALLWGLLILSLFSICSCKRGKINDVEIIIGESALYTEADLRDAADEVLDEFSRGFDGCTLHELKYDEAESLRQADGWAKQYDAEEAIVLHSRFTVSLSYGNGPFSPGDTHYYSWILVRNSGCAWKLKTCGY